MPSDDDCTFDDNKSTSLATTSGTSDLQCPRDKDRASMDLCCGLQAPVKDSWQKYRFVCLHDPNLNLTNNYVQNKIPVEIVNSTNKDTILGKKETCVVRVAKSAFPKNFDPNSYGYERMTGKDENSKLVGALCYACKDGKCVPATLDPKTGKAIDGQYTFKSSCQNNCGDTALSRTPDKSGFAYWWTEKSSNKVGFIIGVVIIGLLLLTVIFLLIIYRNKIFKKKSRTTA